VALHRFKVTGPMPIRDAVTKESIQPGGIVTLDDAPVPRGPGLNGRPAKPLAATNIAALVESGLIAPVAEKKAKD
jgi:hypothetical protein